MWTTPNGQPRGQPSSRQLHMHSQKGSYLDDYWVYFDLCNVVFIVTPVFATETKRKSVIRNARPSPAMEERS
ncbi:hypothetical protein ScPMuIL_003806 [Solemya velum]